MPDNSDNWGNWDEYADGISAIRQNGEKITALMSDQEKEDFAAVEARIHDEITEEFKSSHGSTTKPAEWANWLQESPGTRLIIYNFVHEFFVGGWREDNRNFEMLLPFDLQTHWIGKGGSVRRKQEDFLKVRLAELNTFYAAVLARAQTPQNLWAIYLQQHPELIEAGETWTRFMNAAEKQAFASHENALLTWAQSASSAPSGPWLDWVNGTTVGLRMLFYASAAESGLDNDKTIAKVFPAIIQEPAPGSSFTLPPTPQERWLGLLTPFAQLRDAIKARNAQAPATTIPGTDLTDGGSNLTDLDLPPIDGAPAGGSGWLMALLLVGLLVITDE